MKLPFSFVAVPSPSLAPSSTIVFVCGNKFQLFNPLTKSLQTIEAHADKIVACQFNSNGTLFASVSDSKDLKIWDTTTWECKHTIQVPKRGTAIKFTGNSESILVSDKFGDVFEFSLKGDEPSKLLLGHLSLITDLELSSNNNYIITSDRDEKIRVSNYPKSYIINTFCLGHSQFVTTIHTPNFTQEEVLFSGGGDGLVFFWDIQNGKIISEFDLLQFFKDNSQISQEFVDVLKISTHPKDPLICVIVESNPNVIILELNSERDLKLKQQITLKENPTDVTFTSDGKIWLTTDNPNNLVKTFTLNQGSFIEDETNIQLINSEGSFEVEALPDFFTYKTLRKMQKAGHKLSENLEETEEQESKKRKIE